MSSSFKNLEVFQENRNRLLDLLVQVKTHTEKLGFDVHKDTLMNSEEKLKSENFKLLVLGEFKRGKSTFINALLGQEVLPAFSIPCTAVINEIKWGEKHKALLHFRDDVDFAKLTNLPEKVTQHITKSSSPYPPLEISVEEIEDYVVIPDPGKDQAESVSETPYRLVEIFWPLETCRHGVEIIDSPGLNEHGTRTKVTAEYLSKVDAVIFVMSCQALASQSELSFIDSHIIAAGHEDLFFVCNRFDDIRERERPRLVQYAQDKLSPLTSFRKDGIFFASALKGLDAREKEPVDVQLLEESGIPLFEEKLSHFLSSSRGRIKLAQPAREVLRTLDQAVQEYIPNQIDMLKVDLGTLEKRYNEVKPELAAAESKFNTIISKVQNDRKRLGRSVKSELYGFVVSMSTEIPDWVDDYIPEKKLTLFSKESHKKQIVNLIKEIADYIQSQAEARQTEWMKIKLAPLVEDAIKDLGGNIQSDIEQFYTHVQSIKNHLSSASVNIETASGWDRALSTAAGLFLGGEGSAVVGFYFGHKEMLKSLLPAVGMTFGLLVLGIANPLVWIAVLGSAGFYQTIRTNSSMTKKIAKKVAEEMALDFRKSADQASSDCEKQVLCHTTSLQEKISNSLKSELDNIRKSYEIAVGSVKKGQTYTDLKVAELTQQKQQLLDIKSSVDEIIDDLINLP